MDIWIEFWIEFILTEVHDYAKNLKVTKQLGTPEKSFKQFGSAVLNPVQRRPSLYNIKRIEEVGKQKNNFSKNDIIYTQ